MASMTAVIHPEGPDDDIIRVWTPGTRLKSLYRVYLLVLVWAGILTWLVPLVFLVPAIWTLAITVPLLAAVLLASLWILLYYRSLSCIFTPRELIWQHGVLFRRRDIVPYAGITGIDTREGPVMKMVGVSTLRVMYSTETPAPGTQAEVRIPGVEDPGALRDLIEQYRRKQ